MNFKNKKILIVFILISTLILIGCDGNYEVSTSTKGEGVIELTPEKETYEENDIVEIKAIAKTGWVFNNWSGNISGSENPQKVVINSDTNIIAQFKEIKDVKLNGEGTKENPYQISNAIELQAFKEYPLESNYHYKLTNDIDLKGINWGGVGSRETTDNNFFGGVFDGNNHTISNFKIDTSHKVPSQSNHIRIGFFNTIVEGVVKNLTLKDFEIKDERYSKATGGLVGIMKGGELINNKIIDFKINAPVTTVGGLIGLSSSLNNVEKCIVTNSNLTGRSGGGLIGLITSSKGNSTVSIKKSYFKGNIKVNSVSAVGGLIGSSSRPSYDNYTINLSITDSYAKGVIENEGIIGGLIGSIRNNKAIIERSYFEGDIIGVYSVGGLIGGLDSFENNNIIENSYAKANIKGGRNVGGLIGKVDGSSSKLINSYFAGEIESNEDPIGGLIAYNLYDKSVENSYWDKELSQINHSKGGDGKTTKEMKKESTYLNWDFKNIWTINENEDYPKLKKQVQLHI